MHTCITAMLFCVKETQDRNRFVYCSVQGDSHETRLAEVLISDFSFGCLGTASQCHGNTLDTPFEFVLVCHTTSAFSTYVHNFSRVALG